ncbi:hypothetical protein JMM81_12510 [Bacillus sp. V3B]|uniref:hypothetical protein n=1 Tax=Bacillus sp. V3B TaxID=2804915 RepID=UPI00210A859B|nr:hypothetical protein [Bacillus sp. V3B]MCQ6275778.1 hypothetical protein [Bacillus sp. V3B]
MCEICEGRHVVLRRDSYSVRYDACPNCEPTPPEEHRAKLLAIYKEVAEINAKKMMKGA